ncbi:TRAP transporter small permease [Nesterenkonia halobia]|uniref:Tripartite ATP-independent periplasmic transporters DctQ component domain-containing protein n=1 Tax=Nesterenkonia halobia TaxID=37922 RepID=A0ABP6REL1_9MICC
MNDTAPRRTARDGERFLSNADLAAIDRPDLEVATPRGTDPVNEALRRLGATLAVVSLLIVWALLLLSVALRYLTGSSMDFAAELPAYLYPWIIAGGVIVAMSLGGHIAVDFLLTRLRPGARRGVEVGVWTASGLLFALVTVLCVPLLGPLVEQVTPILGWPRMGSFAAFILMTIALTVQSLARAVHIARGGSEAVPGPAGSAPEEVHGV